MKQSLWRPIEKYALDSRMVMLQHRPVGVLQDHFISPFLFLFFIIIGL